MNHNLIAFILALLLPMAAVAVPPQHVQPQLLSNVQAIRPGDTFTIGVLLRLDEGWHVYWTNPGDSGTPTRLTYEDTKGLRISPNLLPLPEHFDQPGGLIGFGYKNEVLLTASVTASAYLSPGETKITVTVSWLCCNDICIPGQAHLDLTLTVLPAGAVKPEPDHRELFAAWKQRQPQWLGSDAQLLQRIVRDDNEQPGSGTFRWTGYFQPAVHDVEWFMVPDHALMLENQKQSIIADPTPTSTISFTARVLAGQRLSSPWMLVVIGYTDAGGHRHAAATWQRIVLAQSFPPAADAPPSTQP